MPRNTPQINLLVSEEELLQIKNNAKAAGKTVSAYIRETALNLFIFDCDCSDVVNDHTREISSLRNAINQLIFTIEKTGDYYPSELESIYNLMMEILSSEKDFLTLMEKDVLRKKKIVKKQVAAIVNDRIEMLQNEK